MNNVATRKKVTIQLGSKTLKGYEITTKPKKINYPFIKQQYTNLGCGKEFRMKTSSGFICGVPNGNGEEKFCQDCKNKMFIKSNTIKEEDKNAEKL